jgi:eukaryotic-like serine/threonine-protein kinase
LGPYEIVSLIGAGGMGEVYRAHDARLNREVAIKVLPPQYSTDTDRLRRFEQEARAAGALNHPNIVTVYDIGKEGDVVFVVSELLFGETLRERLGGSPLPPRKAIEYALQIAHGLAAAHESNVVHRDLKPENIFLTKDGRVKILDFGLAKLMDPVQPAEGRSRLQTVDPQTQPGVVLGTVGYMSPEQVRGRATDHRSDIFSFGAILYEMLTGKRAFHRDSTADTMSAILKEEPTDLSNMPNVPPSLERVMRHCLEKNPEERFQSARDLAFDLEMVSGASGTSPAQSSTVKTSRGKLLRLAAIPLILAALAGAFYAGRYSVATTTKRTNAIPDNSYPRLTFRRGYVSAARFAPDGQTVVYSAAWVGAPEEIFVTRPQSPVSRALGITNASLLSVSSAGEMAVLLNPQFTVGWQRTGTLARVSIDGGAPREVLNNVQDADWSPDGKNLAAVHVVGGRFKLEYPIGKVIYEANGWMNNIRVSPGGDLIAFMAHPTGGDDRGTVSVVDLQGKVTSLTQEFASESGLHWSLDGKEIWFTASQEGSNEQPVYAVTLQGQRRIVSAMVGNLILQDMDAKGTTLITRDSRRREIVALGPGDSREHDLSWFDWSFARYITPDGKLLVFEEQGVGGGPNYSVFLRKTDGSPAVKLGEGYGFEMSPDGAYVISMLPSDTSHITLLPTGAGQSITIPFPGGAFDVLGARWFADSKRFLASARKSGEASRWQIYDLQTHQFTPVAPPGALGFTPLVSPDQKSILAGTPEGGFAFYPVQGGEPKPVLGIQAGDAPIQWASDNRGVFVASSRQLPARVSIVDLKTGERKLWKEITPLDASGITGTVGVLITPDGQSYAYTYRRVLSDLYLVPGLQ